MYFRIAKRLTSWEAPLDPNRIAEAEFSDPDGNPDLRLSLQEGHDIDSIHDQISAEHVTQINPKRSVLLISVDGLSTSIIHSPSKSAFAYSRDHHCEIVINSVPALGAIIRDLSATFPGRSRSVDLSRVQAYAAGKLREKDPEWVAAARDPGAKKWLRKVADSFNSES